jgi:Outer membrane protein beta-barrel domain
MKKLIVTLLLMYAVLTIANGQFTKIGGGIALSSGFRFHDQLMTGNRSSTIAVSFKGIYKISEPFQISPSFGFFLPNATSEQSSKQTVSSMMFDINGHFILNPSGSIEFYGLAGIDILFTSDKYSSGGSPSNKETDNALGLNLGIGTCLKISEKLGIYGEAKYIFNDKYNQFMINAGALLNINLTKKHENPKIETNYPYRSGNSQY